MQKYTYKEGDEVKVFCQKDLTPAILAEADKIYVQSFNEALDAGYRLSVEVDRMLTTRNLLDGKWEREQAEELENKIAVLENSLRKGIKLDKTPLSKEEAWALSLELRKMRNQKNNIAEDILRYYNNTAENYANVIKFQYVIYALTCDEQGKSFWPNFADYRKDNSELVAVATEKFLKSSNTTENRSKNYEDKWLSKFNCLKDGKLVNLQGVEVDIDGNPIAPAPEIVQDDNWNVEDVEKSTE